MRTLAPALSLIAASTIAAGAFAQSTTIASRLPGKVHLLPATLETTQWGWFDNAQKPVLTIDSGDTVVIETMTGAHNQFMPGITPEAMMKLRADNPGRGPHSVTGPIYVNGAEPGDVVKVKINRIIPRAYAININLPGAAGTGQFPKEFPTGSVRYLYLDWDRKVTEFLPGVYVPLRPFPGVMGVARKDPGRYFTVMPGEFAGNMDIRDFVEGTTLHAPVWVRGGLIWTGDSHAGQGNGEVNLTAIETAFRELNVTISVAKGKSIDMPRIETPRSWINMGFDQDLNKAWDIARQQTIKMIGELRNVSADQAATTMPKISDCRISQVVNIKKGVHCMSPKNANAQEDMERPTRETPRYFVTHAKDADLNAAMNKASLTMIDWLAANKSMNRHDAYGLASVAMDCRLGAMSDGEKNVHCLMPKSLWNVPGK